MLMYHHQTEKEEYVEEESQYADGHNPRSHQVPSMLLKAVVQDFEPACLEEANRSEDWPMWELAMKREYAALEKNKTWMKQHPPQGIKPIGTKLVFRIKPHLVGERRFKARLVVLGYRQSFDPLLDIYASVIGITTLRVILSIAASQDMEIAQFDVSNAFLNRKVKSEVYIAPPDGIDSSSPTSLKLVESLWVS